jgi:hypothetical protein
MNNIKQKNIERELVIEQVESELGVIKLEAEKKMTGYLINMKSHKLV